MDLPPLHEATLIRRYKRFLADVTLADGTEITAHCPNSGSMKGAQAPGSRVWLSHNPDPKRKYAYTWELIEADGTMVGINTHRPNAIVAEAIQAGGIPDLAGYELLRREVKYGVNSRIDIFLESPDRPPAYVEIKNVQMKEETWAAFPDAVTSRGAKHLEELAAMVSQGARAVMLFLVQRDDVTDVRPADAIDPHYGTTLRRVLGEGVEALCLTCAVTPQSITIARSVPLVT